jgi:transposase
LTLGIDEHSFRGRDMALTITNITERKLLAIGKDNSIGTLIGYLKKIPEKQVKEVCIDMDSGYLNALIKYLPTAVITVDKYHVIAYANRMVDQVRRIVVEKNRHSKRLLLTSKEKLNEAQQLKLARLFADHEKFPSLKEAYFIKEKVRDFYQSKNLIDAKQKLEDITMFCENSKSGYIHEFGRSTGRWQEYILNYFINHSTNAFTEGVHTKIKMAKRISFGFKNIYNYIAKMTLAFAPFLILIHHPKC